MTGICRGVISEAIQGDSMADKTPKERITELVNKAQSVSSDVGSRTEVSISDVIAADKHLARTATPGKRMGFRMGVMRGPAQY